MKILVAGVHFHSSFAWSIEQALRRAQHMVECFDYRRPWHIRIPGFNRFWSRKFMPAALLAACKKFRPNLVFIAKGETIPGSVLDAIRCECRCRIVNWFPDARLFAYETLLSQLPFLDSLFSKNAIDLDRLKLLGFSNGRFLHHAADLELHLNYQTSSTTLQPYRCQAALVGSWYPYRDAMACQLLDFDLRVWGGGWQRSSLASQKPQAIVDREARSFEQTCVFRAAAVNINPHHFDDIGSLNQRVFDIAGSGGCQLVDGNRPLGELFEIPNEIETFSSADELREKLHFLLENLDLAREMAIRAQQKVASHHTYDYRIAEILKLLE